MDDIRQFLIDDIKELMYPHTSFDWMDSVSDDGLYTLWQDLINIELE